MSRFSHALPLRPILVALAVVSACTALAEENRDASLRFNTASLLYRQKNWREAAAAFESFLEAHPRHDDAPEARFARGYCLNRLGEHAAAVEELRLARRASGEAAKRWLADANFYLGRSLDALASELVEGSSERRRGAIEAARAYGDAARIRAAERDALPGDAGADATRRALDLHALALSSQGEALYNAGDFAGGVAALAPFHPSGGRGAGAGLGSSSSATRGLYFLALCHYARARAGGTSPEHESFRSAVACLKKLSDAKLESDPLWPEATYLLARLEHRAGARQDALLSYSRVQRKGGARSEEAAFYASLVLFETKTEQTLDAAADGFARFARRFRESPLRPRAAFYEALAHFDRARYDAAAAGLDALFRSRDVERLTADAALQARLRFGQSLLLKPSPDASAAVAVLSSLPPAPANEAPESGELRARAAYWRAEALLAAGDDSLRDAAVAFGEVAKLGDSIPALAEEALHKQCVTLFELGELRSCARVAASYRARYPRGRFVVDSFKLSAKSDPDAAAAHYLKAARRVADAGESRRLRYLAALAAYRGADYALASKTLEGLRASPEARSDFPELPFYLADAIVQASRPAAGASSVPVERHAALGRAMALYGEFLASPPERVDRSRRETALLHRGLCAQWIGDRRSTRAHLAAFLEHSPEHELAPRVRFSLANACLELGDREAALQAYALVARNASDALLTAQANVQAATLARELERPRSALVALDAALAALSGTKSDAHEALATEAKFLRATVLGDLGRDAESEAALDDLVKSGAGALDAAARIQLAHLRLDGDRAGDALELLAPITSKTRREPALPPELVAEAVYITAWAHAAIAADERRDDEGRARALEATDAAYRRIISEHADSEFALDARLELGEQLFNRRDYAAAKRWLESARETLEKSPTSDAERGREMLDRALFGIAFIHSEEKDHAGARKLFDRVSQSPDAGLAVRATFQSARAWMAGHREEQALTRYQRVLATSTPDAKALHEETLLRIGECHHRLREYREAATVLRRLLEAHPRGAFRAEAYFALGFAQQYMDEFEKAMASFRTVVSESRGPVAARAQYHIGECFADQSDHRAAAREFLTVVANFDFDGDYRPWYRRALLAAGISYAAVGDRKAAAQQWSALIDRFPDSLEAKAARQRLQEVPK